jgi:hypothetical protein
MHNQSRAECDSFSVVVASGVRGKLRSRGRACGRDKTERPMIVVDRPDALIDQPTLST